MDESSRHGEQDDPNKSKMKKTYIQIPGMQMLTGGSREDGNTAGGRINGSEESFLAPGLFLLIGPSGAGKSIYCRQFMIDALLSGSYCIFLSSRMNDRQFEMLFPQELRQTLAHSTRFINPFSGSGIGGLEGGDMSRDDTRLSLALAEIKKILSAKRAPSDLGGRSEDAQISTHCVVIDSLTELFLMFDEGAVLKFVTELSLLLQQFEVTAVFTMIISQKAADKPNNSSSTFSSLPDILASIVDGTLEMKWEEKTDGEGGRNGSLVRSIRLLSMRGYYHQPKWVSFIISKSGKLVFGNSSSQALNCTMCGKAIKGTPIMDSDFAFDSLQCAETYKKFVGVYGSSISEIGGLPSQVVNVNFFFVDIVGLSNPALSVKKQIEKIEILNRLIGSCDAFAKTKEKKIVLPTGDGMAIGFFSSVESPLILSRQLHSKLRDFNRNRREVMEQDGQGELDSSSENETEKLGMRIGLGSGPVFIVSDITGNQNIWGPGIILARRVMDIGDNMHILLSGNMAEMLTSIRDEYKIIIKPIGKYQIKHGQTIDIYSAHSSDFGNSSTPVKMLAGNVK